MRPPAFKMSIRCLTGGLPLGAITEIVGPECSGRTSFALSFIACMTQTAKVCAWIDVSDVLNAESAAAAGVDLSRLLWVRCGVPAGTHVQPALQPAFSLPEKYFIPPPIKQGLHGGGFGSHPRNEAKGLSDAVSGLLRPKTLVPRCAEPQPRVKPEREVYRSNPQRPGVKHNRKPIPLGKSLSRIEQAMRVTDLLLQGGGFSAIVLDMGSIAPEYATRVPLATWFRYRAAAEKTQASILLLTQHSCAKSSAELLLRLQPGHALGEEATLFTGIEHHVEVVRRRFMEASTNVIPLRKPPQRASAASWRSQTLWAGRR